MNGSYMSEEGGFLHLMQLISRQILPTCLTTEKHKQDKRKDSAECEHLNSSYMQEERCP